MGLPRQLVEMADSVQPTDLNQQDKYAFGGFFPVKRLKSKFSTSGGGGEWLVAYRAEQRRRINAVLTTLPDSKVKSRHRYASPEHSDSSNGVLQLDSEFVLNWMHVRDPLDVMEMNISGCGLEDGEPEELQAFSSVVKVHASENKLPFELFDNFKHLRELEIALNGITRMDLTCQNFPFLQVVDLSYNSLNDEAILSLGLLPALKELHLTGNSLVLLPAEMSRPYHPEQNGSERMEEPIVRFPCLERLWLDDNRFTDLSTFAILAGLKRLKELYLDNNEIYCIPFLKLLGLNNVQNPSAPSTREGCYSRASIFTPVETSGDTTRVHTAANPIGGKEGTERILLQKQPSLSQLPPPFPQLELISLSNNLILSAESLLPVKEWPNLKEMRIHGNPLTFTNRGMPPLIQQELVENGKIQVVRRSSELRKRDKPSLAERSKDLKKIPSSLPLLIPKQPVLPALERGPHSPGPALCGANRPSLPPLNVSKPSNESGMTTQQSESDGEQHQGEPENEAANQEGKQSGVFLTQIDEHVPTATPYHPAVDTAHADTTSSTSNSKKMFEQDKSINNTLPPRYRGYEALLDARPDPTVSIPSDIRGCTKALKQLLQHPLMLPNPKKAHLSLKQPDKIPHSGLLVPDTKGTSVPQTGDSVDAVLPVKVKEMEDILSDIKHQCLELEMSLSDVLSSNDNLPKTKPLVQHSPMEEEAKLLLEEVQKRFVDIRKAVMNCQPQKLEAAIF